MSTTLVYIVLCPKCRKEYRLELCEIELDPACRWCGAELGHLVRVEGFKRADG